MDNKNLKIYGLYTIMFSVIFIAGFQAFWLNDRTFILRGDGIATYYVALDFGGRFFRQVIRNIFSGYFAIPTFDFRIGLGDNALGFHPFMMFDVFGLMSTFVPRSHTEFLYNFIVAARFYLSGFGFLHFCMYMKHKGYYSVVGALAYAFSGFAIAGGVRHPLFLLGFLYTPFIIEGLDRILVGKKPLMFMGSIFLLSLTGYYFVYMILIFCIPYVIIRIHHLYPDMFIKKTFLLGGYAAFTTVLAMLMAAAILLPLILLFFQSGRVGHVNVDSLWFWGLGDFQNFLMRSIGGVPSSLGLFFPPLIIISFIWLLFGKQNLHITLSEKRHMLYLLGVLLIIRFVPAGSMLMHGFSYPTFRWTFLLLFVSAIVMVRAGAEVIELKGKLLFGSLLAILAYSVAIFLTPRFQTGPHYIALLIFISTIACLAYPSNGFKKIINLKKVAFMALLAGNLIANINLLYSDRFLGRTEQFVPAGTAKSLFVNIPAAIRPVCGFHRIDVASGGLQNSPLVNDYFGLSSYLSTMNGRLTQFTSELEISPAQSFRIIHFNHSARLNSLLSVQYYVSRNRQRARYVPFGYYEIGQENEMWLFKNYFHLPLGFTYKNAVSRQNYEQLNPVEKQEIMLYAVVLEREDLHGENPQLRTTQMPFTISEKYNLTWENGLLDVQRNNATMTLEFEGLPNSETYVRISGFNSDTRDRTNVTFGGVLFNQTWRTTFWRDNYYSAAHAYDYTVNLGFRYEPQTRVTLTFADRGIYDLTNIEIFCLPMDNFPAKIEALREYTLENLTLGTNRINGEITITSNRYLFFSIPYSRGWRATVNGVQTSILRANTAFMALELEAGYHLIELTYRTPGVRVGIILSIIGFVSFFLISKYHNRILLSINKL